MTVQASLTRPHQAKLSVADFLVLNEAGAFDSYAKSELINGTIYVMNAAYSNHAKAQAELAYQLRQALEAAGVVATIFTAGSVELARDSLPEPDIVVADDHADGPIPGAKVKLVVEIADSTIKTDLGRKARLYARSGVPEYWVADIEAGKIHQQWNAAAKGYTQRREVAFGDPIEAASLAGLKVQTSGL